VRTRHDDPPVPEDISPRDLDRGARAELKTLTKENSDFVAAHLLMAARLLDTDPELAHQHALSAARKGGRIGVVRESLAITAYTVGDFALALRELRTFRRISGSNDQLPLMVDSERGVGRPDRALELGRSVPREELSPTVQVALAIAMSGARLDLGQPEVALAELEIPQLDPDTAYAYSPPLFRAYAEVLQELGREEEAQRWSRRAEVAEEALAPADDDVVEIEDAGIEDEGDDEGVDAESLELESGTDAETASESDDAEIGAAGAEADADIEAEATEGDVDEAPDAADGTESGAAREAAGLEYGSSDEVEPDDAADHGEPGTAPVAEAIPDAGEAPAEADVEADPESDRIPNESDAQEGR
jgi:23S rRNA pseudouridine2605 synthase